MDAHQPVLTGLGAIRRAAPDAVPVKGSGSRSSPIARINHADYMAHKQDEPRALYEDGLANGSLQACLHAVHQQDVRSSRRYPRAPPALAQLLPEPMGLPCQTLQPSHARSSPCCKMRASGSTSAEAFVVGPTLGALEFMHVRPERPAWLEEAAQRMSQGVGLSGRGS